MITVTALKTLVADMQAQISTINKSEVVIDDSQVTKFLEEWKIAENFFLFAIIPEYPLIGDQDRLKWKNQLMFMILQKYESKSNKHSDFLNILNATQATVKEFVYKLLSERSGDNGDFCGIANELKEDSIRVYPIWNKSGCHGWGIDVDLLSNP